MRILEYGTIGMPTVIFIHGFESPYQIWNDYIQYYKAKYHILVPVLQGHDVEEKSEFTSFEVMVKEIEDYCLGKSIDHVEAVYGMSMGGILAAHLWLHKRLIISKLIMESSALLRWNKFMIKILTKQYLMITQKARERDAKVVQGAVNSMVTEDMLDVFLELLDGISDSTIENFLREVGKFSLPEDIENSETQIFYFYGGTVSENVFKKVAKYIDKHIGNATTVCLKGKGHCEDALLHPEQWIKVLDHYF